MTALENKILQALKEKMDCLAEYDADCKANYDKHMARAAQQTSNYWKEDEERIARFELSWQKHGYDFLESWKNVISMAMYGRVYHEWHSAQAGRYRGTGHAAYVTTELSEQEIKNVDEVFRRLVNKGYLKKSKSGKQATFKG